MCKLPYLLCDLEKGHYSEPQFPLLSNENNDALLCRLNEITVTSTVSGIGSVISINRTDNSIIHHSPCPQEHIEA